MYKKNLNTISSENDLENKYLKEFYSGFSGFLFKLSHQNLEKNLNKNTYSKILEIGAGPHPQINYIKHNFNDYYVLLPSAPPDWNVEEFIKESNKIPGRKVPEGFAYNSSTNEVFLSFEELRNLLKKELFV